MIMKTPASACDVRELNCWRYQWCRGDGSAVASGGLCGPLPTFLRTLWATHSAATSLARLVSARAARYRRYRRIVKHINNVSSASPAVAAGSAPAVPQGQGRGQVILM
jgi:hypothetical protein